MNEKAILKPFRNVVARLRPSWQQHEISIMKHIYEFIVGKKLYFLSDLLLQHQSSVDLSKHHSMYTEELVFYLVQR